MQITVAKYRDLERWDVKAFFLPKVLWSEKYMRKIGEITRRRQMEYRENGCPVMLSIHFGGTMTERERKDIKGKLFIAKPNDLVFSKIDVRNGALGIISDKYKEVCFTSEFPVYEICGDVEKHYLALLLRSDYFLESLNAMVSGASGRKRINPEQFESIKIPLPPLPVQKQIVIAYYSFKEKAEKLKKEADEKVKYIDTFLMQELGIVRKEQTRRREAFTVNFADLERWGVQFCLWSIASRSVNFDTVNLDERPDLFELLARGKSPKYSSKSEEIILNQKCNRWNELNISYAKNVEGTWLDSVNKDLFSREGDILINSTGEGTIGRATVITSRFIGLLHDSHMILLRLDESKILPLFFVYVFNSVYGQEQVNLIKSAQSTKQTELGVDNLKKINFPFPSISVQRTIVDKVEKMREEINFKRKEAKKLLRNAKKELEERILGE